MYSLLNIIIISRSATASSMANTWTHVSMGFRSSKLRICLLVIKYRHYFATCTRIFKGEYIDANEYGVLEAQKSGSDC